MKQVIQDLKSGETILEEVPAPQVKSGCVLIKTTYSLVSLGTERMLVEFGKANLIEKARSQPDKVKMVLDKVKTDGLMPTMNSVFNKLGEPLPLGYCNVGKVIAVGKGVSEFSVGDRVASNGNHAEIVVVPKNLAARIPDEVSDEAAAFTVIGSIGLQGIRLANPTIGETVVVVGLGLIGLITAELLKANGCNVIGFDYDQAKVDIAKEKGIDAVNLSDGVDQVKYVKEATNEIGVDAVLITASNKSNEIISNAAKMCRKRGRIVLIGVIGLDISRADFFEKELTFQVSCSYGPGRYDEDYEQKGQDYPIGYVRWTEKRNFETILNSLAKGMIDVKPLITEVFDLKDYNEIYGNIGSSKSIASLLRYPGDVEYKSIVDVSDSSYSAGKSMGVIGAGNFTNSMILPCLDKAKASVKAIASSGGLSAKTLAKKFRIPEAASDYKMILNDNDISTVLVTTRHNSHAKLTLEALDAGKHVFVEKPLALTNDEIDSIIESTERNKRSVVVGFNRRFSPHTSRIKKYINEGSLVNLVATMNAGFIPQDSWVHDLDVGGGRLVGEACHFVDLLSFLAESPVKAVCTNIIGNETKENSDNASILLKFENGSNGVINYFSNGSKAYSKERIEVYSQERTFVCDNFRTTKAYGVGGFNTLRTSQDKGHSKQFELLTKFTNSGGKPIIPFKEIINVSKASLAIIESIKEKRWIQVE